MIININVIKDKFDKMEEPVACIRENNRNLLQLNRRIHRDEIKDVRRTVTSCMTTENVSETTMKLKTKAAISDKELNQLKNALMDDPKNIEIVLSVHGALRGLVRELTGNDVKKQCAAAGCFCNLAMGDSKACLTIAKAAGTYLTAAVDNLATELAVTCVWTLGNLAASNVKVCDILISQGAISKIMELHPNTELQEACLYSLKHFAYQMGDELKAEHLYTIHQTLSQLQLTIESSQVLFILSCHKDFPEAITEELVLKWLEMFIKCMEKHLSCSPRNQCCELVYICRTLANTTPIAYEFILKFLMSNNASDLCRRVLLHTNNKELNNSLLWLFGNIYNMCGGTEFFSLLNSANTSSHMSLCGL